MAIEHENKAFGVEEQIANVFACSSTIPLTYTGKYLKTLNDSILLSEQLLPHAGDKDDKLHTFVPSIVNLKKW
jgi:hypothetical protein